MNMVELIIGLYWSYDFFEKNWTFYNSYLTRQGNGLFITEAYIMVRYVKSMQYFISTL